MPRTYRATGADGPFGDPRRAHGVAVEGYYWRFTDASAGRVVVALCGINQASDGCWASVALAAHPGAFLREAIVPSAGADERGLGAWSVGGAFAADAGRVRVDLGPGAQLDVRIEDVQGWPRRPFGALGVAQALPGLSQYWHPHVLGGRVDGRAVLGDEVVELGRADVYAEKNWGRGGFPERWWWGQAQGFERPDVCVAFAGGDVTAGPLKLQATAVVVRLGAAVIRLGNPVLSPVRAAATGGRWSLRGRAPRWSIELEAHAQQGDAFDLPVPLPMQRRTVPAAHQHLAGRLRVLVRRRGRPYFAGESALAGLERGVLDATEAPREPRTGATSRGEIPCKPDPIPS